MKITKAKPAHEMAETISPLKWSACASDRLTPLQVSTYQLEHMVFKSESHYKVWI